MKIPPRLLTFLALALSAGAAAASPGADGPTVALWLFDEPIGLYPSTPLESAAGLDAPLVLGLGGTVVEGKFGHALSTEPYPPVEIPPQGQKTAALHRFPVPAGRTQEPLSWHNAQFTALMTGGERQVRKEVSFASATRTDLNLGDFDWTVEFWFRAQHADGTGVVFELGTGPRGENDVVTRLTADVKGGAFVWENQPAGVTLRIPSQATALTDTGAWHHYAFCHDVRAGRLTHYVDGRRQGGAHPVALRRLPPGDEDYLSVGRDAKWARPLPGLLDELRVSRTVVYQAEFAPPGSLAPVVPAVTLRRGLPLLFAPDAPRTGVVSLGSRKHLFIDGAFIERSSHVTFAAHPPSRIDRVIGSTPDSFRKHLTVVEDDSGLIRIYNGGPDDYLMVQVSQDGLNFTEPDTGLHHQGQKNIVIAESAALGRPFLDPNGPPEQRWKYVSGLEGRGVYLYTSPDGWKWTRHPGAVLSFRSGSQSSLFYDEQRGSYVGFHRTGFPRSEGGATRREFVRSETSDLYRPWPVPLQTQQQVRAIAQTRPLREPQPWWLDNGPLTPGDFGIELPSVFAPDDAIDPPGSGVYSAKADKYPWAPDTYLAFPVMYFDYEDPLQPRTRRVLYDDKSRGLGSGLVETQVAVSRDSVTWTRYPSPTYLQVGNYAGRQLNQIYIAEGMIRRGDEVWQYFFGNVEYHSPAQRVRGGAGVYRAVQRLDGFVSADAPLPAVG